MCDAKLSNSRIRPIQLFKNVRDAIISQIIPIFQKEAWDQQCKIFSDDIDRKLDCLELDQALKEWLLSRLKVLNDELKKQNQASVEWVDDDAAGIRR